MKDDFKNLDDYDEIDLSKLFKILINYKRLFIITLTFTFILFSIFYFLYFKSKIIYKTNTTIFTDIPVEILNVAVKELPLTHNSKITIYGKNKVFNIYSISSSKSTSFSNINKYLQHLENKYKPILEKTIKKSIENLKRNRFEFTLQINSLSFDYDIYILNKTKEFPIKKYPIKKMLFFLFLLLLVVIFVDIVIVLVINK